MTKVRVQVSPVVTAGTDRGGEDLEILVYAEIEGGVNFLPKTIADLKLEFDDDFEVIGGQHTFRTCHYDFKWKGSEESVLDMESDYLKLDMKNDYLKDMPKPPRVRDMLLSPVWWTFCHSPGESERLKFEFKSFIDGNAD